MNSFYNFYKIHTVKVLGMGEGGLVRFAHRYLYNVSVRGSCNHFKKHLQKEHYD